MKIGTATEFQETEIGRIPGDWITKRLDEVSDIQTGPFGSQLHERDYVEKGTPIITVEHISNDRIDHGGVVPQVSESDTVRLSKRYGLKTGDIVFSRVGSVDRSAYVSEEEDGWLFSGRLLRVRPNPAFVNSRWLDFWLRQEVIKEFVRNVAVGATMPSINTSLLGEVPVAIPKIDEQRKIAEILSSLDDKIELNRAINVNLEKLANAVFKKWFVDIGDDLPEGWRTGTVSELSIIARDVLNPVRFQQELFDHYSIPAFDEGRTAKVELGSSIKSQKSIVPENAVLLSKLNPRTPRIWLPFLNKSRRAICSTEFLVVIPKAWVSREFLYCLFSSSNFINNFATLVTGTSGSHQRVKPESLLNIEIVIPPIQILDRFAELVRPFLDLINENIRESNYVRLVRDSLLPRLMSGRIRVS